MFGSVSWVHTAESGTGGSAEMLPEDSRGAASSGGLSEAVPSSVIRVEEVRDEPGTSCACIDLAIPVREAGTDVDASRFGARRDVIHPGGRENAGGGEKRSS